MANLTFPNELSSVNSHSALPFAENRNCESSLTTLVLSRPTPSPLANPVNSIFPWRAIIQSFSPPPLLLPFISYLENGNRFLTHLSASSLVPLHFILNTRVRRILLKSKSDLFSPLLETLQRLAIALRINWKSFGVPTWFTLHPVPLLLSSHYLPFSLQSLRSTWRLPPASCCSLYDQVCLRTFVLASTCLMSSFASGLSTNVTLSVRPSLNYLQKIVTPPPHSLSG